MAPLKFRAWHNGKMIYLGPLCLDYTAGFWTKEDDNYRLKATRDFDLSPRSYEGRFYNHDDFNEDADGAILMQSTGLKDKNGVPIYEGDIDKSGHPVEWFNGSFICNGMYICEPGGSPSWVEVVGNAYEHPSLLINGKA